MHWAFGTSSSCAFPIVVSWTFLSKDVPACKKLCSLFESWFLSKQVILASNYSQNSVSLCICAMLLHIPETIFMTHKLLHVYFKHVLYFIIRMKYIVGFFLQETQRLMAEPVPGIKATVDEQNTRYFHVTIDGPKDVICFLLLYLHLWFW